MNIAIVGDPHITEYIRERQDNYLQAVLRKLEYIAEKNDKVILLGDVFDKPTNSDYLFYRVYSLMKRHEGKFITILGNHDIIHHNYEQLNKTTIGSLAKTGVVKIAMNDFELDGLQFVVSLCKRDMKEVPVDETNTKILLGHNYFEQEESESFTRDELSDLNYSLIFLGHDHKPYDDMYIGHSILVRMGSLTRKDTQEYNETREIKYVRLDSKTGEFEYEYLPEDIAKPSTYVFYPDSFGKKKVKRIEINYAQISKLLEKFSKQGAGNISLDKVLRRIKTPVKSINYIKNLHELENIKYS